MPINLAVDATMLSVMTVRMCEHGRTCVLIGKRVKRDNKSVIKEHHLFCNHSSGFDDFSILVSNSNDFEATLMESLAKNTLMESLLINRDHPLLNKTCQSLLLELFNDSEHKFII